MIIQLAARVAEQMEADGAEPGGTWTRTATLVGPQMAPGAIEVVKQELEKISIDAGIGQGQPWPALELLAAGYLAGRWTPPVDQTGHVEIAESDERPGLRHVFAQPDYRRLWVARTVSQWGDTFNFVALALLIYDLTGSGLGVSGVVVAEILPVLLLAPLVTGLPLLARVVERFVHAYGDDDT